MSEDKGTQLHLKAWNATAYKDDYYGATNPESEYFMKHYVNYFSNCTELLKRAPNDRKILELGCGPCICYGAAAVAAGYSTIKQSISYSDLMEDNKVMIEKWMEKAPNCVDWSPHMNYLSKLSGKSVSDIEDNTRSTFKDALICDVTAPNIPIPGMECKFDVVITNLCVEACCHTMDEWKIATRKILKLLKPGGILIQGGMRNLGHAMIGGVKYPTLRFKKEEVHRTVADEDNMEFLDEHWQDLDFAETNDCKHDGMYFLMFKKTK